MNEQERNPWEQVGKVNASGPATRLAGPGIPLGAPVNRPSYGGLDSDGDWEEAWPAAPQPVDEDARFFFSAAQKAQVDDKPGAFQKCVRTV
jgi:hypothetical protein